MQRSQAQFMSISPHAAVDPRARIAPDAEIGPFCVIGPDVTIGPGCRLLSSVTVLGRTTIGAGNVIYPNAVLGAPPQDRKYRGEPTELHIGDNNQIREAVTVHCGTAKGGGITAIGNSNLLMVNCHVGHDARIGSNCTVANNVMIAGHVVVGDFVVMSGAVGIHHFVTVGDYAFIGGASRIHHDVPPYVIVDGADVIRGANVVGLRRAGFGEGDIEVIEDVCRRLFGRDKPFATVLREVEAENGHNQHVRKLIEFLRQRDLGVHGRYLERLRQR